MRDGLGVRRARCGGSHRLDDRRIFEQSAQRRGEARHHAQLQHEDSVVGAQLHGRSRARRHTRDHERLPLHVEAEARRPVGVAQLPVKVLAELVRFALAARVDGRHRAL
eukprot:2456020-Prymnesium_polylepis.2